MPSPKAKDIQKIIENSARIMEDMIWALFFMDMCGLCLRESNVGTASAASLHCAHEKKQGGHSQHQKVRSKSEAIIATMLHVNKIPRETLYFSGTSIST